VKNATAIAVGFGYGCALVAGGVKCAGNNQEGQLGDGTYFDSATPVDVVGLGSGVIAISAGYFATCALTTAGAAKCWGMNRYGQLGDGSAIGSPVPVDVRGIDACAGFVDVDNADALCANVAWLRNRQITLGCLPEAYCPFGAVTRLAMAAFLNRTGTIFATPPVLEQALTGGFDPTTARVVCDTADVPVATHPRRAHVDAVFTATSAADLALAAELAASNDHGATWQALSAAPHVGSIIATRWANLRTLGHYDLEAGESVRFGIVVSRGGLPGAATIADSACNLRARLDNRNATTPPLD
jgi:hypothetical protein